jgi:hypothetical protein
MSREFYRMKKIVSEVLIYFAILILMGGLGAIYSLIFADIVGGAAIGFAPEASFRLLEKQICSDGSSIEYTASMPEVSGTAAKSYNVKCIFANGGQQDVKAHAILVMMRSFFLLCFIPTFIAGAILMWFTVHRWSQRNSESDIKPPEPDDK